MGRIVVVGSINMDIVAQVPRMPVPGETVVGTAVSQLPGGKGANQAVAASRAGGNTVMIGAVGSDAFADSLVSFLESENLDTSNVSRVAGASGTALITLDAVGENSIVVICGANGYLSAEAIESFDLVRSDVLLLQHEIPAPLNELAAQCAKNAGALVILNTAPYRDPGATLLNQLDYLIVNETEFAALHGKMAAEISPPRVAELLETVGIAANVVVTLGAEGVVARIGGEVIRLAGHSVPVTDTTGAGDCFCGAFAAALARDEKPSTAIKFANAAAALSVQAMGAGPSMPHHHEIVALLTR